MKVAYWDEESGSQKERDMTLTELAQRDADMAAAAVVAVPSEVTMRQARLALLARGALGQVDAAIETLGSPNRETARIEWDYSSVVSRNSPLVVLMGAALGLDDDALDQLFINAATL